MQLQIKSDGRKCNSGQKWNNDNCRFEGKNPIKHCVFKEDYTWSHNTCAYEIDESFKNYRNKNKQKPFLINENQICKLVTLLKPYM